MTLSEIKELITPPVTVVFSTIDKSGHPDLRALTLHYIDDTGMYFVTSNTKNFYKQLQENPYVSFACEVKEIFFRISGKIEFIEDDIRKQEIYNDLHPILKSIYPSIYDRGFTLLCLPSGIFKYSDGFMPFETHHF